MIQATPCHVRIQAGASGGDAPGPCTPRARDSSPPEPMPRFPELLRTLCQRVADRLPPTTAKPAANLLPTCCQPATCCQSCCQPVANMMPTCCRHVAKHVADLLLTCCQLCQTRGRQFGNRWAMGLVDRRPGSPNCRMWGGHRRGHSFIRSGHAPPLRWDRRRLLRAILLNRVC